MFFKLKIKFLKMIVTRALREESELIQGYLSPLVSTFNIENDYKISTTITADIFLKTINQHPISYTIIENFKERTQVSLSLEQLEKIRTNISVYITLTCIKDISSRPKTLKNKSQRIFKGDFIQSAFQIAKNERVTLDNEIIALSSLLDSNFSSDTQVSEREGRPNSRCEDYFLFRLKKTLQKENESKYMQNLLKINYFLKENYAYIFHSIPYSEIAIKQAIQRFNKTSIKT